MMMRKSQLNTPFTILGTPRCFSPKRSRMTASRKKATAAASSMVLSSRSLRRTTGRKRNFSISAPTTASVKQDAASATGKGRPSRP